MAKAAKPVTPSGWRSTARTDAKAGATSCRRPEDLHQDSMYRE